MHPNEPRLRAQLPCRAEDCQLIYIDRQANQNRIRAIRILSGTNRRLRPATADYPTIRTSNQSEQNQRLEETRTTAASLSDTPRRRASQPLSLSAFEPDSRQPPVKQAVRRHLAHKCRPPSSDKSERPVWRRRLLGVSGRRQPESDSRRTV